MSDDVCAVNRHGHGPKTSPRRAAYPSLEFFVSDTLATGQPQGEQSRSAGARVVAAPGRLLPAGSDPALIIRAFLDDAPPTEPGEPQLVADAHTALFAVVGAVLLFPAIGIMA